LERMRSNSSRNHGSSTRARAGRRDVAERASTGRQFISNAKDCFCLALVASPRRASDEVLKAARASSVPPILVITARDQVEDMVAGLDLGADDYIIKLFELRILLARIRASTRRVSDRSNLLVSSKEITLDPSTYVVTFRGIESTLSTREFAVLYALMERPGTILSRSQIENRIYGWSEEVQSNAVDLAIHGLRKKYGKDIIRNIRGAGWMVTRAAS
jgi:DNA-binding response OmpR family regulator